MIFGAIPIQIKAENTKIHFLHSSKQILITKLFQVGVPSTWVDHLFMEQCKLNSTLLEEDSSSADSHSLLKSNNKHHTHNMTILHNPEEHPNSLHGLSSSRPKPIFSRTASLDTLNLPLSMSLPASAALAKNHNQQHQQPYQYNHTYMCKSMFALSFIIGFHDEQQQQQQHPNPANHDHQIGVQSQIVQLQKLLFSHFGVIELRIRRLMRYCTISIKNALRTAIQQAQEAGVLKKHFQGFSFTMKLEQQVLHSDLELQRASKDMFTFVHTFFSAPRLERPLWLRGTSVPWEREQLFTQFSSHFFSILQATDQQFLASVVTAVLSNHLSWIAPFLVCCTSIVCNLLYFFSVKTN